MFYEGPKHYHKTTNTDRIFIAGLSTRPGSTSGRSGQRRVGVRRNESCVDF
jgi:hypothetical protein